jgi:hypothetical protein
MDDIHAQAVIAAPLGGKLFGLNNLFLRAPM